MKPRSVRTLKFLIPASIFVIILFIGSLALQQSVIADSRIPEIPGFEGRQTTNVLEGVPAPEGRESIVATAQEGWETVFEADFEGANWEDAWLNVSQGGTGYKYGVRDVQNTLDPFSTGEAWAVGQSPAGDPALNPAVDGYPDNVSSWLIAGPFDFTEVANINLSLEYSFEADDGDSFAIHASTDLVNFSGPERSGGPGGWEPVEVDLSSYAGKPLVWVAFIFKSDDIPNTQDKPGLFIDNVLIETKGATNSYLPFVAYQVPPTPEVTPTPTITPGDDYYTGFTNNIEGWEEVMWSVGSDFDLRHSDSCEDDVCGFLNLKVEESDEYAITSPEVPVKPYPYTIETIAKMRSPRNNGDMYGIIFGASSSGGPCPAADFSTCFNQYYELRIRYRDNGDDQWMEFKVIRVDGHNADRQPVGEDLTDWITTDEDPDNFMEWDVRVRPNGEIVIKADDDEEAVIDDQTYLNNPYFGLMVRSSPTTSSEVKFDSFEVKD